jgi:hypothetical protein
MADVFTYYGCPMCGAEEALIDTTLGICKQCGYDGSESLALTYQQTMNATTNGNLAVSAELPNGTIVTITGDRHAGCTFSVPFGTRITLTSTPVAHYNHNTWTGEVSETTGGALNITAKYVVKAATSFGATYAAQQKIDWSCTTHGEATISYTLAGVAVTDTIDQADNGDIYVDNATEVVLTSVPDTGYIHCTWAMNDATNLATGTNTTNTISFTIVKYTAIDYAQVALVSEAVTIYMVGDDGVAVIEESSPTGDGANITIEVLPSDGMEVKSAYQINITDFGDDDELSVTANAFDTGELTADAYIILIVLGEES